MDRPVKDRRSGLGAVGKVVGRRSRIGPFRSVVVWCVWAVQVCNGTVRWDQERRLRRGGVWMGAARQDKNPQPGEAGG